MNVDTKYLRERVHTLEGGLEGLSSKDDSETLRDLLSDACVKNFAIILEQGCKLLRRRLAAYMATNRQVDCLTYKDVFRHAAKHGLMDVEAVERWFAYRDNYNSAVQEDGDVAEATLKLLPMLVADAKTLAEAVGGEGDG